MRAKSWIAIWVLLGIAACASADAPAYGEPTRFAKGREIVFPDFSIRYLGERQVAGPQFPRGFRYYDFEVKAGGETRTVSWTSGTGVIDSASFEIGGKPFELEMRGSVARKGWLRDDEFVLWPRAQFQQALEAARRRKN